MMSFAGRLERLGELHTASEHPWESSQIHRIAWCGAQNTFMHRMLAMNGQGLVSFQWKNVDFLLKNVDFIIKPDQRWDLFSARSGAGQRC